MSRPPTPGSDPTVHDAARRTIDRLLGAWVAAVGRRARGTVACVALLSIAFGTYAVTHLGFNVDPNSFFSDELRFQQAIKEFERYFPVLTNSLLIVVDGETPELTRAAAEVLVDDLDAQREVFHRAFHPGEDRFFERYGLLYGSVAEIDDFADHMALLQPVLGELAHELSLATLAEVIQTGLEQEDTTGDAHEGWRSVLGHLAEAASSASRGDRARLSWERVLVRGTGIEPRTRSVIVADPILDLERILAAERAIEAVRASVLQLGLVAEKGVEVRITGYPAINHEEMISLATDTSVSGILSFLLVVAILAVAFRTWRLVLASAITLIVGLVWAAALAALSVQELNPHSITFGVLVIGLGIDFMIHLGMHFVERVREGEGVEAALAGSIRDTGAALVLCATTTGVGFMAFVPTEFQGISDLGMAAAGGMLSILVLTLTLLPPLIRMLVDEATCVRLRARPAGLAGRIPHVAGPGLVVAIALLLGAAALPLVSRVDLDTNVISFRNQSQPSVRAFKDLLEDIETTPWFLDALVPSLDQAESLAERMRDLPEVERAVTLLDFVPEEQDEKVEILGDVALMLGLPSEVTRVEASPEAQLAALRGLRDFLASEPSRVDPRVSASAERLRVELSAFIEVAEAEPDGPALRRLSELVLDPLPEQLERLQASLEVEPITREDLPAGLVERMVSSDGHARIQVYPTGDLWSHDVMVGFVEAIRPIWGEITGLPVNLVESARATWKSLREALVLATAAIALMLIVLWRSFVKTGVVLGPLLLAVLLTLVSTVVLPITFNFATVIVLPLLIGIGVDSGIHLVERASARMRLGTGLLESTTARAVFFSALSTVASFGTLMISGHRAVASLGALLVVGMIWTLAANLVLLPALLELRERGRARRARRE